MTEQVQISNLTPFAYERQCLERPESWMSWYIPGFAICQTDTGNRFFPLTVEEKEHFHYGEAVEFEYLEDWNKLPAYCLEVVAQLQEVTDKLAPLGLAAVSIERDNYTLYYAELDAYFILKKQNLEQLSSKTIHGLSKLEPNVFSQAQHIYLSEDGSITS